MTVDLFRTENKNIKKLKVVFTCLTYLSIALVIIYSLTLAVMSIKMSTNFENEIQLVAGSCFIVVSILFAYSGIKINLRIKKYFTEFYDENSKMLWAATVGLSLPIMFRGVLDVIR